MSEGVRLICFCCHYGGKFDKVNGQLAYVGGGVRFIDTKAEDVLSTLMNELPISLYGQRVFYKLPFEGYEDIKILLNGHPNFQKMYEASVYTGAMDIAIEPDVEEENGETKNQNEDGSAIRYDEEERVEREVGHLSDDVEFAEYDGFSDDSEVEIGGKNYCKYKKGSGEFVLGQVFDSLDDFKEGVLDYSLKNQRNIHYCRWDQDKSEVRCAYVPEEDKELCSWRLYCSVEVPLQKWMVKTFYNKHVCPETRFSKIVTDQVIAKLFLHDIRIDHNYMPRRIQMEVEQRWNKVVTLDQCRNARRKALEMLRSEYEEQFTRLRDYRAELLRSNEGSTIELDTVRGDDGTDLFLRFYVCFAALRRTWCTYCRPIFGLDGCFLKCSTKGQLLAAVGRDANNQMYPIAWAVVDVENEDNWMWFISKLQTDLRLGNGEGFSVISDRQKGLLNALSHFLPKIEHQMCARHIYANLKKNYPGRKEMKKLFWKVCKACNKAHYTIRSDKVNAYDMKVWESMMNKNPENCSLAYFDITSCCDDVSNNISESFNHAINGARELPLVEMLETIRRRAMLRIEARRKKSLNHKGTFSLKSVEKVDKEKQKLKYCTAFPSGARVFEVQEKSCAYKVDFDARTCACRKWDMCGLPCRHALKVFEDKKLNEEHYMSSWYLTTRWRNEYTENISPVLGMKFWPKTAEPLILPPQPPVPQGRPPVPKRIKERNESPTKKKKKNVAEVSPTKVSREKRVVHCENCG